MYTEGFQQWFKMNKNFGSPLMGWNKACAGMYQSISEQQLELLSGNLTLLSDQLKRFSQIKTPEDYFNLSRDVIQEDMNTLINNLQILLQATLLQLEEFINLTNTYTEKATKAAKSMGNKSSEKDKEKSNQ
jgi:hypothetical protein